MNNFKNRDEQLEIPLSEYLKIKKGVCRESALLTILGLNSLGTESYYYYAKVSTCFDGNLKNEDHAVVANLDNCFWVVDNYFRAFNKQKLDDLHSIEGVNCKSGLMYEPQNNAISGTANILISRLYPETRHKIV